MSFLQLLHRLFSLLFNRRVIAILGADPDRENYSLGLKLVAIDRWKTRWTIIEGHRDARVNRDGIWYMPYMEMNETFVFTLKEAKAFVAGLVAELSLPAAASEPAAAQRSN